MKVNARFHKQTTNLGEDDLLPIKCHTMVEITRGVLAEEKFEVIQGITCKCPKTEATN